MHVHFSYELVVGSKLFKKKFIITYLYACIGVIYLLGFRRKESKDNTLLDS